MITSLDQNKKFKIKAKIDKQASDLQIKLNKRCIAERLKYDKLIESQVAKIQNRYELKLQKRLKKISSQYDRSRIDKKKKILGKEVKKKLPTTNKMKKDALTEIQKYAKLSKAIWSTEWPMIYLVDKCKRVPLTSKVNGWHVYPQSNYRNMMFLENNIRPISNWWNKQQADNIAEWRFNLPKEIQIELEQLSKDKWEKRKLMDHNDYQMVIDKYKQLNEIEKKRLNMV